MAKQPAKPLTAWQKWKAQPDALDLLCDRLIAGESLTAVAKSIGTQVSHLSEWVAADTERSARAKQASIVAARSYADLALQALQEAADPFGVSKAREIASHYRWMAARANPNAYGDRTVLAGDPNAPLIVTQAQRDAAVKAAAGSE